MIRAYSVDNKIAESSNGLCASPDLESMELTGILSVFCGLDESFAKKQCSDNEVHRVHQRIRYSCSPIAKC